MSQAAASPNGRPGRSVPVPVEVGRLELRTGLTESPVAGAIDLGEHRAMLSEAPPTDLRTDGELVAGPCGGRASGHTVDPSAVTGAPPNAGTVAVAQAVVVTGAFGAVLTLAAVGRAANRAAELAHAVRRMTAEARA